LHHKPNQQTNYDTTTTDGRLADADSASWPCKGKHYGHFSRDLHTITRWRKSMRHRHPT